MSKESDHNELIDALNWIAESIDRNTAAIHHNTASLATPGEDDLIIPNTNPNLIGLGIWVGEGEIQTHDLPVIAWRVTRQEENPGDSPYDVLTPIYSENICDPSNFDEIILFDRLGNCSVRLLDGRRNLDREQAIAEVVGWIRSMRQKGKRYVSRQRYG